MKTLEEVLQELKQIEKSRQDIVLPMKSLRVHEDLRINSDTYGQFDVSEPSVKKLCNRYGLSHSHIDTLIKNERRDLVAETFNHFLKHDDKPMKIRTVGGDRIKGIVEKDYQPFDDYDVFTQVNEFVGKYGLDYRVEIVNKDDEFTRVRLMINDISRNMGMAHEGGIDRDIVQGGFEITNSEIGSKMGINSLVYRQVCSNGMMGLITDEENKEIFYKRGKDFNPFSRVPAMNRGVMNAIDKSDSNIKLFRKTRDISIESPEDEFIRIGRRYNLGKIHVEGMQESYKIEPQNNLYSIINSVTRYSTGFKKDYSTRSKFEFVANDMLEKVGS